MKGPTMSDGLTDLRQGVFDVLAHSLKVGAFEALRDGKWARQHSEQTPGGGGSSWTCIPIDDAMAVHERSAGAAPLDVERTDYADIQRVIHNVLDRDGQHDWDETARLTELIAPAVWNEIHTFPIAYEASAGAAPLDVERLKVALDRVAGTGTGQRNRDFAQRLAADYARRP